MELQHITFDYGVQMKAAQFKSNASNIVLLLGGLLKCGGPKVKEAIRSEARPRFQTDQTKAQNGGG